MSDKFCTLEDAKGYLRTADSWTGDDPLIEAQIVAATALIKEFTRRDWVRAEYTDYFNTADIDIAIRQGRDFVAFSLREKNVSVAEGEYPVLKFNTGGDWANTTALTTDTYAVDTRLSRIIMYPQKMRSYDRSIRCVYTAGFARDETDTDLVLVPSNIATATAMQAAFATQRILNATTGSSSKKNKTGQTTFAVKASGLVAEAQALIRQEVRLMMGSNA